LIYSDEDKLSEDGHYYDPYFKPDWNPDLFLSQNYLNHFSVYRKAAVLAVGGFREGFEGSQDYDLALRVTGRATADQIRHIPRILYHWRAIATSTASCGTAKPYTVEAARRALAEHLVRTGHPDAVALPAPGCIGMWRIRYGLPETPPRVSIIIPTRNGYALLHTCVESLLNLTSYPDYELLIVDNGSDDPETLDYLASLEQRENIRVIRDDRPFNYAALNNLAARQASGTVLALLNNDTEVIQGDWLREMVSHALRPEIGAVGARLWYPDDRLQHGGCILGVGGVANHAFLGLPRSQVGYFGRSALIQNYSAVTAACLVIRKEVYDAVQGLDETHLAVAFNDVDFCLRVREAGYRNLWTPYAELYHHESASRGQDMTGEKRARFVREVEYMMQRWGDILEHDPAYNPNLSLEDAQFRIARHPRLPALAS
jgi:GT2 family glycosyltransferase